jgi:hypothetical protein
MKPAPIAVNSYVDIAAVTGIPLIKRVRLAAIDAARE